MKLVVAAVITNFETHVVDDQGMEQMDHLLARPVAEKVLMGFKRLPTA
jgi:hypothetical protein